MSKKDIRRVNGRGDVLSGEHEWVFPGLELFEKYKHLKAADYIRLTRGPAYEDPLIVVKL